MNIPAFEPEELMPPESSERQEVRLFYVAGTVGSPDTYWREESQNWKKGLDKFMLKAGTAAVAARKTVAGLPDPEAKIRALYERAQTCQAMQPTRPDRMRIEVDDLSRPQVHALLREHLDDMYAISPPESVHALDLQQLRKPDVTF